MLVLLSVILIYVAGWTAELWYWRTPDFLLLLLVSAANLSYGLICFRIDYLRWGDRLLWGLSFLLMLYSFLFHWDFYMRVVGGRDDYMLFFMIMVVVATPTLALTGPVRTAVLGVRRGRSDENADADADAWL